MRRAILILGEPKEDLRPKMYQSLERKINIARLVLPKYPSTLVVAFYHLP